VEEVVENPSEDQNPNQNGDKTMVSDDKPEKEIERAENLYHDDPDKAKEIYESNRGPLDADTDEWAHNMNVHGSVNDDGSND